MAGVGLVGYSGSLTKDAIAGSPLPGLLGIKMDLPVSEPVEDTSVLVGQSSSSRNLVHELHSSRPV